ncbi:MAG TPA: PIN domain-containing protein [Longimicrobiales bacterium]|nr:PIN domain-containing protein [Longimicrobiales bacterium]
MSPAFVDTSGLYALMVASDDFHERARAAFALLRREDARMVTTSYVLVETYALLQRRVGWEAVDALRRHLAPLLEVVWVDAPIHERALDHLQERGATSVSLVDATSFVVMRARSIGRAFAFDAHFTDEGFALVA